jgi:hypothetical protein
MPSTSPRANGCSRWFGSDLSGRLLELPHSPRPRSTHTSFCHSGLVRFGKEFCLLLFAYLMTLTKYLETLSYAAIHAKREVPLTTDVECYVALRTGRVVI